MATNVDPQELVPLESGLPRSRPHPSRSLSVPSRNCYRGPLRLCRMLALLIVLPSLFIMIPLYMRYRVFLGQMYPMSMTDMRLIDNKISPTWCQRQVVRSNATFNAFVVPGAPSMSQELVPVSMTRELELEDDMKEYWGFYLLKGSSVTVSTCVSYPGASLIMIKGYRHLQDCAYIGDDSSEEVEEVVEAYNLGLMSNTTFMEKIKELRLKKVDGKANDPGAMRRHKAGVSFHDPNTVANLTSSEDFPTNADITDHDPKELKELLERLHALRQAAKTESLKYYRPPSHLMSLPALHRHRDANVDVEERRFISFKDIDNSEVSKENNTQNETTNTNTEVKIILNSTENTQTLNNKNLLLHDKTAESNKIINYTFEFNNRIDNDNKDTVKTVKNNIGKDSLKEDGKIDDVLEVKEEFNIKEEKLGVKENQKKIIIKENKEKLAIQENQEQLNIKVNNDKLDKEEKFDTKVKQESLSIKENQETLTVIENEENMGAKVKLELKEVNTEFSTTPEPEPNSKEVFEDVLQRLQALGDKGKRVLIRLHETMGVEYKEKDLKKSSIMSSITGSSEELDHLRNVLVEAIDEEKNRSQREKRRKESMVEGRAKRELMLGQVELTKELNEDDEARDYAAEEGLEPDGYAEHHSTVNETTALDMSNSEFWSSFSSSEEALLECAGLILNLPLTPQLTCHKDASEHDAQQASRANALTYSSEEALLEFAGLILNLPLTPQLTCHKDATEHDAQQASKANALTYRVPANGYYFFVFNSENEVQKNFIRAKFDLQKTRYDVARTKLRECTNSTNSCHLNLDIFSSQKVVLEVPLRDNDSLWNEQFVIISECEPRTSIYLFCVIAVPILIIIFAFQ